MQKIADVDKRAADAGAADRPALLFVTPFVPLEQGRGTAMRARANLTALCELFAVTVAIINPDREELKNIPAELRAACAAIVVVEERGAFHWLSAHTPGWRLKHLLQMAWPATLAAAGTRRALRMLSRTVDLSKFSVIHCFRLHVGGLVDMARPGTLVGARLVLDLDDYESHARLRGGSGPRLGAFTAVARFLEGVKYWLSEARLIPQFDEIYVCSALDKAKLTHRFPDSEWAVVPNVVSNPLSGPAVPASCFTFLFVGTLDYRPNKDAIVFFCEEVLPLLRQATVLPFKVRIVGRNPDAVLMKLGETEGTEVIANPVDIAPYYRAADVCIAPIRAGGGTRIKILEAFSYRLPVISTTIGAEGLNVVASKHAEIADSASAFAAACGRLLVNPAECRRLGAAGYEHYLLHFSPKMLRSLFRDLHAANSNHPGPT